MALVEQKGVVKMPTNKRNLVHLVDELMDELVRFREQVDSVDAEEEDKDIEDNDYEDEEQDE